MSELQSVLYVHNLGRISDRLAPAVRERAQQQGLHLIAPTLYAEQRDGEGGTIRVVRPVSAEAAIIDQALAELGPDSTIVTNSRGLQSLGHCARELLAPTGSR